jgi:hypothetical protein
MGLPPKTNAVRKVFLDQIESIESIYKLMLPVTARSPIKLKSGDIHPKQAERIIGQSFLNLASSFESFVEFLFMRYLAGAPYPNGGYPTRRVTAKSVAHAYEVFSGEADFDPEKKYLSFSDWKKVREKASIYFEDSKPFGDVIEVYIQRMADAVKIRNRMAHASDKSRADFKQVAKFFIKGDLHQSFSAGKLLCAKVAHGFGQIPGDTLFESYIGLYRNLADTLAPAK